MASQMNGQMAIGCDQSTIIGNDKIFLTDQKNPFNASQTCDLLSKQPATEVPKQKSLSLSNQERSLNLGKLRTMLDQFGEFPAKYRLLTWKTLLQLPMAQEAYETLA
jgi:hypothetical protein